VLQPSKKAAYKVLRPLGEGGIGQVFLAKHGGQQVALKFLRSTLDSKLVEFFQEEVRLLSQLSHPNLVKIYDFLDPELGATLFESETKIKVPQSSPCFSMEFIEGLSLEQIPHPISGDQWIDIMAQLCNGLHYLHSRNILHRDLKPPNLFLTEKGELKILDFSISVHLQSDAAKTQMGTMAYMAPEVFLGDYDWRSDLFSVGVLSYGLLARTHPFGKALTAGNLEKIKAPEPLLKKRPDLPAYLCDLIESLLQLSPSKRPSSALTVWRVLQEHANHPLPALDAAETATILQKTPLVGRDSEMKVLSRASRKETAPGRPTVVLLRGLTGIGRSRLVEEVKWQLLLNHRRFLQLDSQIAPRWAWVLLEKLGDFSKEASRDFLSQMHRLNKFFSEKFICLACCDLQNWPSASLQELKFFLQGLAQTNTPGAFILEYNSETMGQDFDLRKDFPPSTIDLELKDLSAQDTATLLKESNFGNALSQVETDAIFKATRGRPLLVLEAQRQILLGKSGESLELEIPQNFQEASRLRVRQLSPPAQELLSLILTDLESASMENLHRIGNFKSFESAAMELDSQGLILSRSPEMREFQLAYPSLKMSLLDALPENLLQKSHRSWLDFLSSHLGEKPPDPLVLRAMEHAFGAQDPTFQEKWSQEALQALARMGRFEEAIEWSDRFLKIASTSQQRCILFAYRAPYFSRLGKFEDSLDAYTNWWKLRIDDETQLQKVRYCFLAGHTLISAGKVDQAKQRLEECLKTGNSQAHPDLGPFHARSHILLAGLLENKGELAAAREQLKKAQSLGQGHPDLEVEIEQHLGTLSVKELRFEEAKEHYQKALAQSQALGKPQAEALAKNILGMLLRHMGKISESKKEMLPAVELAKAGGELPQWARYSCNLGLVFLEDGNLARALNELRRAEELLRIFGTEESQLVAKIQLALAYLALGNWEKLQASLDFLQGKSDLLKKLSLMPSLLDLQAETAYLRGDFSGAEKFFQSSAEAFGNLSGQAGLLAKIGAQRARARAQPPLPGDSSLEELLEALKSTDNPILLQWRAVLLFLSQNPKGLSEEAFLSFHKNISALENPELRLEQFSLVAIHLARSGLRKMAMNFLKICRQIWNQVYQNLPEEYRMTFEKNRNLGQLEETLSKVPETPSPIPATAPEAKSSAITDARFRQFCEITRQIAQKTDLNEILERVMDAAIELSDAERGFLLLKNDSKKKGNLPGFEVKTARHINQQSLNEEEFQFSFSVVKQAITHGAPVLTDDAQQDSRFLEAKSIHQFQLQSILVIPLELEGKVLGALYLDNRRQTQRFQPSNITLITGFANQAVLAIQKAQMLEALKEANEKLEVQVKSQAQHIEVLSEELSVTKRNLRYDYKDIIGKSPAMMKVFELLDHVTQTKIPVWIWGESGTGKELIARSLHFNSPRKNGPFVTENCSAIPENLLESELFGHKKGAFTHADRDRIGLFEQASGGTLFLDEVADMSLGMQVKLLRVLQEGEVRPLGSNKLVKIEVRLVTASNKDLQQLVKEGKFRQDLFFRINGMTLRLPPLRERKEDIPVFVHFLLKKIAKEFDLKPSEVAPQVFEELMKYSWPGNVRELEGVVRSLLLFAAGKPITMEILKRHEGLFSQESVGTTAPEKAVGDTWLSPEDLPKDLAEERKELLEALRKHRMDKKRVAEELGISLKSVYARLERYGVPKKSLALARFLKEAKE